MRIDQPVPEPPELGEHDGIAYALFVPDERPRAGIVICHGAGSAKESHFDFGRAARGSGFAALAYDARGHGSSAGEWGPWAIDDALAMCELMRAQALAVALRGSSMGGFTAIHAAAAAPVARSICAVAAICPAPEDMLLRGLRAGRFEFSVARAETEHWLGGLDTGQAVRSLAGRTALLLMHARGDEQVPYTVSEELAQAAADAGVEHRVLIVPGGHHRSLQHDGEMQAETLRFIGRAARAVEKQQ